MKTHDLGHVNRIGELPEGALNLNLCHLLAPLSPIVIGTVDNGASAVYHNRLMLMQQLQGILPTIADHSPFGYDLQSLHHQPLKPQSSDKHNPPIPWTADKYSNVNPSRSLGNDDCGGRCSRRTIPHTSSSTKLSATPKEPQVSVSPTRFNPFAQCEPLTADVDTNRLYPRINRTSLISSRQALNDLNNPPFHSLLKPTSLTRSQGNININVTCNPLSRRLLSSQEMFKSVDYLVDLMSTDRRHYVVNNNTCNTKQMTDDEETGPSGTTVEYLEVPRFVRALADRVSGSAPDRESSIATATNSDVVSSSLNSSTGSLGRYQCSECPKSYSTVGGVMKHRQFYCRSQEPSTTIHQHRTVASKPSGESRDQRCPQCDKSYSSASALKMHIRTHTLPCRCRLCGKAFSRPWLLQGHLRTHTGEKPFECPHCSRAFADRSNLRAHLQTHYDVKQYNCAVCRRTFSRMSLLLKHRYGPCSSNAESAAGSGAEQSGPAKPSSATDSSGNLRSRLDNVGRRW